METHPISILSSIPSEGLAKWGITRDIGMTISSHLAVPLIIANSNLIATVTREIAEPYLEKYGLQIFKLPHVLGLIGPVSAVALGPWSRV